ncbi:MAG: penicillin-binding protein 2 [Armatimonadetes bacterium]|nr:penicillin-binding protein 2 [Armatimonadota bacterium]
MTLPYEPTENHHRLRILTAVIYAVFVALTGRLWYLQISRGEEFAQKALGNIIRELPIRAPRGIITDRKGKTLASSRPTFTVTAVPGEMTDPEDTFLRLSRILNRPAEELQEIVQTKKASNYDAVVLQRDLDDDTYLYLIWKQMLMPGIECREDPVRWYPDGKLTAHLLGYPGELNQEELDRYKEQGYRPGDFIGKSGIEKTYESYLRGQDGARRLEVNARGQIQQILGEREPVPGHTLALTLDKEMQKAADQALGSQVGSAVALDVNTGEVLAMVSKPSYDPNIFARGITSEEWQSLINLPTRPLQNRAMSNAYPPGSTFKTITALAGLESGSPVVHYAVHCPGSYRIGRRTFRCWRRHDTVDLNEAIAQSCDVFFYQLGLDIGPDKIAEYARLFGLGSPTGIDLPGERRGTIPDPRWKEEVRGEKWYGGNTANMSIGQGDVQCTPLQMVRVTATIANGGTLYRPYVIRKILAPDGQTVKSFEPVVERKIAVSEASLNAVRHGMRQAVVGRRGTAKRILFTDLTTAGKTGSAEDPPRKAHAWFICYAPYENPKIAICAMVEQGGHGGTTAAPIARAMLERYFHIQGAPVAGGQTD